MIAIRAVAMVGTTAKDIIEEMSGYDQHNRRHQQPELVIVQDLLEHKKYKAEEKNDQGEKLMMVFAITM